MSAAIEAAVIGVPTVVVALACGFVGAAFVAGRAELRTAPIAKCQTPDELPVAAVRVTPEVPVIVPVALEPMVRCVHVPSGVCTQSRRKLNEPGGLP